MLVIENHAPATNLLVKSTMGTFHTKRTMVMFGDSLAEVSEWLSASPMNWRTRQSTVDFGKDWTLGHNWSDCQRFAREGWPDGLAQLDDTLSLVSPPENTMHYNRYDVAGEYVDPVCYSVGDPSCMVTRRKLKGHKPVIRLVVGGNASAAITGQEMMNYGAALTSMVHRIESSGRRVELDVLYSSRLANNSMLVSGWNVKHAEDHLDLAAVAFSLAHPGAFRRFGFAMMERTPKSMESHGYGYATDLQREFLPDADENAILISGINHNPGACRTIAKALTFVAEQINSAAGETLVTL